MKLTSLLFGTVLTAGLLAATNLPAPAYMKLGDIKGEATTAGREDTMEIYGFNFEAALEVDPTSGQSGPAKLIKFGVAKDVDKATPLLIGGLVTGTTYADASIEFTKSVGSAGEQTYLKYELKNVLISSYSSSGGGSSQGDSVPVDSLSLNFEELKVIYTPLDLEGTPTGNPVEHTWLVNPPEPQ